MGAHSIILHRYSKEITKKKIIQGSTKRQGISVRGGRGGTIKRKKETGTILPSQGVIWFGIKQKRLKSNRCERTEAETKKKTAVDKQKKRVSPQKQRKSQGKVWRRGGTGKARRAPTPSRKSE